jgi:hypothetical protein
MIHVMALSGFQDCTVLNGTVTCFERIWKETVVEWGLIWAVAWRKWGKSRKILGGIHRFKLKTSCQQVTVTAMGPGSIPVLIIWDLWWSNYNTSGCSPSTSVSPANVHPTNRFIFINHPVIWFYIISTVGTSSNYQLKKGSLLFKA